MNAGSKKPIKINILAIFCLTNQLCFYCVFSGQKNNTLHASKENEGVQNSKVQIFVCLFKRILA